MNRDYHTVLKSSSLSTFTLNRIKSLADQDLSDMMRRASNPMASYTSHEYTQKVVPLFSEMSRSKALRAEANFLMEKNQTAVFKMQSYDETCDCSSNSSDSLPLMPSIDSSPNLQAKIYDAPSHPSSSGSGQICSTPSIMSGSAIVPPEERSSSSNRSHLNAIAVSLDEPSYLSETLSSIEKLQPLRRQTYNVNMFDSVDGDSCPPEQSYAEYLKARAAPAEKSLPLPRLAPSASLMQGTSASASRRQSLPSSPVKDFVTPTIKPVTNSPSANLLPATTTPAIKPVANVPSASLLSGTAASQKKQLKAVTPNPIGSPIRSVTPVISSRRNSSPLDTTNTTPESSQYKRRHSLGTPPTGGLLPPAPTYSLKAPVPRRQSITNSYSVFSNSEEDSSHAQRAGLLSRSSDIDRALTSSGKSTEIEKPRVKQAFERISDTGSEVSGKQKEGQDQCWEIIPGASCTHSSVEATTDLYGLHLQEEQRRNNAARCIVGMFLRQRAARFSPVNGPKPSIYRISRFFSIVVSHPTPI